jgi:hypothetical protein
VGRRRKPAAASSTAALENPIYRKGGTSLTDPDLPPDGFNYEDLVGWQARDLGGDFASIGDVVVIIAWLGNMTVDHLGDRLVVPLLMVENPGGFYTERLWTNLADIREPDESTPKKAPYVQTIVPEFADLLARDWRQELHDYWARTGQLAEGPRCGR